MINLEEFDKRLKEHHAEMAVLRQKINIIQKQAQEELQACQIALYRVSGAIAELEQLKKLHGQQDAKNGQSEEAGERHQKKANRSRVVENEPASNH